MTIINPLTLLNRLELTFEISQQCVDLSDRIRQYTTITHDTDVMFELLYAFSENNMVNT